LGVLVALLVRRVKNLSRRGAQDIEHVGSTHDDAEV
jgi:hypothetical protein